MLIRFPFLLISFFLFISNNAPAQPSPHSIHRYTLTSINQEKIPLNQFAGKKILIVNIASHCGYTKQLAPLERCAQTYKDKLVIIGVPSDDFNQSPENDEEMHHFCTKNYGVTFLLTTKTHIIGKNKSPLFHFLTEKKLNGVSDNTITWNFNKFLLDEKGALIKKFDASVSPEDKELLHYLQ